MARYTAQVTSAAALADDTAFAWLMGTANGGGLLRRVILGVRHTTAATTAFATPPTQGAEATDFFTIPFNAKSGVDIPAEFLEEFEIAKLATDGFAFVNRSGALPASHVFELFFEWEE